MKETWCILNPFLAVPIFIAQIVTLVWWANLVDCISIGIWGGCLMILTIMDLRPVLLAITVFAADLSGLMLIIAYSCSVSVWSCDLTNNCDARLGFDIFFIVCGVLVICINSGILVKLIARSHNPTTSYSWRNNNNMSSHTTMRLPENDYECPITISNNIIPSFKAPNPPVKHPPLFSAPGTMVPKLNNMASMTNSSAYLPYHPENEYECPITIASNIIPSLKAPNPPVKHQSLFSAPGTIVPIKPHEFRYVLPNPDAVNSVLFEMSNNMESNDYEELQCNICFQIFDDGIRKPKWMPCNHTMCLLCLTELRQSGNEFSCPFCRCSFVQENIDRLPNDFMLLHHPMESEKIKIEPTVEYEEEINLREASWCLICQTVEQFGCTSSGHLSVQLPVDIARYLELQLFQEMLICEMERFNNHHQQEAKKELEASPESTKMEITNVDEELTWCLTCETPVNHKCSSFGHVSIDKLPVDAVRNFEQLLDMYQSMEAKEEKWYNNEQEEEIHTCPEIETAPMELTSKAEMLEVSTKKETWDDTSSLGSVYEGDELMWCLTCETKVSYGKCLSSGHSSIKLPLEFIRRLVANHFLHQQEKSEDVEITDFC